MEKITNGITLHSVYYYFAHILKYKDRIFFCPPIEFDLEIYIRILAYLTAPITGDHPHGVCSLAYTSAK